MHRLNSLPLDQVRMPHRLLNRQHRSGGQSRIAQCLNCSLVTRHRLQLALDHIDHLRAIFHPVGIIYEARIAAELRLANQITQLDPMMIEPREDEDITLARLEHPGRR